MIKVNLAALAFAASLTAVGRRAVQEGDAVNKAFASVGIALPGTPP